jgi:HK97 gp10 family phage protein
MDITINTSQVEVLKDFFNDLSNRDQRKIFMVAFRKASKPLITDAKATVPRRTGNLAKSIGSIALSSEIALLVGAKKGGGYKGWHGHLIENGTVDRFRRSKNNAPTGRMNPTHFFESAYNKNEKGVIDSVEEEWLKAIDQCIVRINKRGK